MTELIQKRKEMVIELKESYYKQAIKNVELAKVKRDEGFLI